MYFNVYGVVSKSTRTLALVAQGAVKRDLLASPKLSWSLAFFLQTTVQNDRETLLAGGIKLGGSDPMLCIRMSQIQPITLLG